MNTTPAAALPTVTPKIVNLGPDEYSKGRDVYLVEFYWTGVDRACTGGTQTTNLRNAERLAACCRAGKLFSDICIKRDITGQSYVSCTRHVFGKYLNADLRRLGF